MRAGGVPAGVDAARVRSGGQLAGADGARPRPRPHAEGFGARPADKGGARAWWLPAGGKARWNWSSSFRRGRTARCTRRRSTPRACCGSTHRRGRARWWRLPAGVETTGWKWTAACGGGGRRCTRRRSTPRAFCGSTRGRGRARWWHCPWASTRRGAEWVQLCAGGGRHRVRAPYNAEGVLRLDPQTGACALVALPAGVTAVVEVVLAAAGADGALRAAVRAEGVLRLDPRTGVRCWWRCPWASKRVRCGVAALRRGRTARCTPAQR